MCIPKIITGCFIACGALAFDVERAVGQEKLPADVRRMIAEAGNTADEATRLATLEKLAASEVADAGLQKEAASLAAIVKKWNSASGGEYIGQMQRNGPRGTADYDFQVADDSPLRPIAELYRGRMLAWLLLQDSNIRGNREAAKRYKDEAIRSFQAAERAFLENPIPGMYQGRAVPWPKSYAPAPSAPRWAVLQREHLDRTRDIILWWIEHRQRADGSFGGGWGDDCEMWRWWSPVLLGFDDPKITAAQRQFSEAALARPHLKGWFLDRLTDVEHAAEDTTDNLVPLMLLDPQASQWTDWSRQLTGIMDRIWTGRNDRGGRQFRSFYFSASDVSDKPQRALDVIANVAAVNPALLVWLKTREPELGRPLCEWLDTWVEATARAENGKPAGMLPASLSWPSGRVAGAGDNWWEPVVPGGSMYGYYLWPSVITELTDAMLVAHLVTGEEKYLAPIRSMAAARLRYLKNPPTSLPAPGSEAWCTAQLAPRDSANSNTGALVKTLARCRALLGTQEFDELIALEGAEFAISGDVVTVRAVESALSNSLATLRVNFPGFTSEVHGTDRVMRFVQFLAEDYRFDDYAGVTLPKNELVYRMVTGDANAPRFPMPAVRWLTPPTDIATLVTAADLRQFEAELFHFGNEPRTLQAELRLLTAGRYRVELLAEGRLLNNEQPALAVTSSPAIVQIQLPPQRRCTLRIAAIAEHAEPATSTKGGTLVVGHKWDDSVGFYDIATGKLQHKVEVGRRPHEMAMSRDGTLAFVTLYGIDLYTETAEGGRSLAIVDLQRREKIGEIELGKYRRPHGVEVGHRTGLVYVTCDHPAALLVLDPKERRVVRSIELADPKSLSHMTVVDHEEQTAFVANCGTGSVSMIDLKAGRERKQISIGGVPMGMALTSDGRTLFATNRTADGVAVIDAVEGKLRRIIEVPGQPVRLCLTPDGRLLLATLIAAGEAAIIDVPTLMVTRRVPIGARVEGLLVEPAGRWAYASAQADDKVVRFSLSDGRPAQAIGTAPRPDPLLILPWK